MPKLQATQNSILSYEKRNPGTTTYHRSAAVELNGAIDQAIFKKAITIVMQRHQMLKARLTEQSDSAFFETIPDNKLPNDNNWPLTYIDATTLESALVDDLYKTLDALGKKDFIEKPFKFGKEPMWRAAMVKLSDTRYQFALLFHQLIVDEKSIGIILEDISTVYNALLHSEHPDLLDISTHQSIDISLPESETQKRLAFWEDDLRGLNVVKLETDKSAAHPFNFEGKRIPFKLDKELVNKLKANFPDISLNSIFLTALYALHYRYTGETDISIGITSSNRRQDHAIPRAEMNRMVNAYFNSLPVRINPENADKLFFKDILAIVTQNVEAGLQNQLPHDEILRYALPTQTRTSLPTASLFNCLLATNGVKPTLALEGVTASRFIELDLGHSKFESFGINCDELADGSYQCFIEFNKDRFSPDMIHRLVGHFQNILAFAANQPDVGLSDIPILTHHELHQFARLNHTSAEAVYTGSVSDLMHSAAMSAPCDQPAFVFHREDGGKESTNYLDVETRSNQLAAYIHHVDSGDAPVAICLSRSLNLMKATIAAFKTGRTFVMIDPQDPESIEGLLNTTQPTAVIVDKSSQALFKNKAIKSINLDDTETNSKIDSCSSDYQPPDVNADSIAYIMRTSGSTSTPKMVACTHGALMNLLNSLMFDQKHHPHTKILGTAPATFDGFLYDILLALATTGEVHITYDKGRLSPGVIKHVISNEQIDFAAFTAEILAQLDEKLPLKRVISMGSMAHENTLKRWTKAGKHVENDIGHTETGIQLSTHRYKLGDDCALIGKPIRNMKMIILDPHGNICPPGVRGELFVSGTGVAADYCTNPELTQQKFRYAKLDRKNQRYIFTDSPDASSKKLYATGDYCTYAADADDKLAVKFVCRQGDLVKIHGMRVETNEVRQTLGRHPLVNRVIILRTNDVEPSLIAYILPTENISLEDMRKELRRFLATTHLPAAAYPKKIIMLSMLPLNKNGKLDASLLPPFIEPKPVPSLKPQSILQGLLINIWAKTLEIEAGEIDLTTTFRELGGDSLSLANLERRLNHSSALYSHLGISKKTKIGINLLSKDMTILDLEKSLTALSQCRNINAMFVEAPSQPQLISSNVQDDAKKHASAL